MDGQVLVGIDPQFRSRILSESVGHFENGNGDRVVTVGRLTKNRSEIGRDGRRGISVHSECLA